MSAAARVDWWLRYDATGASSRYRALQYFDRLALDGWVSSARTMAPFQRGRLRQVTGVSRRLFHIATSSWGSPSDVVVVQKELVMPAFLGRRWMARHLSARPLVWDIDDAVWELSPSRRRQSEHLVQSADVVVAGSPMLAEWCEGTGAKRVALIPTCTSVPDRLPVREATEPVIAWVGSHSTAPFLEEIGAVVRDVLDGDLPCRFEAVGGPLPAALRHHPRAVSRGWSAEVEGDVLGRAAIGVAPAPRTPFADGKCGLKVVQYAANGMAVVATDNPAHRFLLEGSDWLTSSLDGWRRALRCLVSDAATRAEVGAANWQRARDRLSIDVGASQWSKVLSDVR